MYKCLVEFLKTRKGKYVLFLGAGTSISSGGRTTQEIVDDVTERYGLDSRNPWNAFYNFLRKTGKRERSAALSKYFEDMKPSPGYEVIAKLIDEGYFRLILTTNFDFMLEECLKKTRLVLNKDYFICIVGGEKKGILTRKLEDESMIRIVKLHGDYKTGILPFTEEETFMFEKEIEEQLKRLTKEGIVFVGYSGIDRDVLKCLSHEGESLWWVNPKKITADTTVSEKNPDEYMLNQEIYKILINRNSHENFFWGEEGKSDTFFERIYERISIRDINKFCDLFKFDAKRYRNMKDLFEPPYQYEEMKQKLEKYGVLLILGEPHLGKTYTALNLLYDYYVEGFDVDYKSEFHREKWKWKIMYQWEKLLKPEMFIYLEDPFGKTNPENIQIFESELKRIIERIQSSGSKVIITSRLNIFKKIGDPNEFPMVVELMKQDISYDLKKRKRIIDKYAAVYKPIWQELLNENVSKKKEKLKEYIAKELTEPHNIDLFFEKSNKIEDVGLLLRKIQESKEILKVFEREVKSSNTAEKVFFYICYIFRERRGNLDTIRNYYPKLIKIFLTDPYYYDFNKIIQQYDFRVETYREFGKLRIKFSHPDFSSAIENSFTENSVLIGKILIELTRDENASFRQIFVEILKDNFERLPRECRKSLFELIEDRDTYVRKRAAWIIKDNFEKLPEEYKKLLFKLAEDRNTYVRKSAAKTLRDNFRKLSKEYWGLLLRLLEDTVNEIRMIATETLLENFEKLSKEDEFFNFRKYIVKILGNNLEKLSREYRKILFDLAYDKEVSVRIEVVKILGNNFWKLSKKDRKILVKLKKDEDVRVRDTLSETFWSSWQ